VVQEVRFLGTVQEVSDGEVLAGEIAPFLIEFLSPLGRVGDEQVEIPVVVVVEENRPLRVADMLQARRLGDLLEDAATLVAEEEVAAARAGDEQILAAVVPGVGEDGGDANAVAHANARLLRDVREAAVAVIAEQGIAAELIGEIDVVVTVAI